LDSGDKLGIGLSRAEQAVCNAAQRVDELISPAEAELLNVKLRSLNVSHRELGRPCARRGDAPGTKPLLPLQLLQAGFGLDRAGSKPISAWSSGGARSRSWTSWGARSTRGARSEDAGSGSGSAWGSWPCETRY